MPIKELLKEIWKWYSYTRPIRKMLGSIADDTQQLKLFFRIYQGDVKIRTEQGIMELHRINKITSVATARCLTYLLGLFISMRSDENIEFVSAKRLPDFPDSNIVCIGGPNTNEATEKIFEIEDQEMWLPYVFGGEKGKKDEIIKIDENTKTKKWFSGEKFDYGIIIKTRNPYFKEKWILILAGLCPEATTGASFFFHSKRKQIAKRFENRPFGVVIKVDTQLGYKSAKEVDYSVLFP
ncbi:MAG: hypothetical protein PVF58_15385 [Candidatus Methanofastidiosia archaeon]|jgi:hypothetical protein